MKKSKSFKKFIKDEKQKEAAILTIMVITSALLATSGVLLFLI